jgi:hypothetical protein
VHSCYCACRAGGLLTMLAHTAVPLTRSSHPLPCCMQPDRIGQVTATTQMLSSGGQIIGPVLGGLLDQAGASFVEAAPV